MSGAMITLTGDRRLAQKLGGLSMAARGRALEKVLLAGAMVVVGDAKRRVPWRTGNLCRSIHVGGYGPQGGLESPTTGRDIGGKKIGAASAEVSVGTNVSYAKFVELGTSRMGARPYLRPALDMNKDRIISVVGDAFKDILRGI